MCQFLIFDTPHELCRYNSKDVKSRLKTLKAQCSRDLPAIDGIEATLLYARNDDVNTVNEDRLNELPGQEVNPSDGLHLLACIPAVCVTESRTFQDSFENTRWGTL